MNPLLTTEGANIKKAYEPITMKEFDSMMSDFKGKLSKREAKEIKIFRNCLEQGLIAEGVISGFTLCDNPKCEPCRRLEAATKLALDIKAAINP